MLSLHGLTIIFYLAAWALLLNAVFRQQQLPAKPLLAVITIGLCAHYLAVFWSLRTDAGYQFGIFKVPSLFFAVINSVVLVSSFRKPLQNLFLFLLPLSIAALLTNILTGENAKLGHSLTAPVISHILLSILAYSLLTIASLQALLLAYQNHQLKTKHLTGMMRLMPPLQTMETLLFEMIWAGQILLTLSLITGFTFIHNMTAQHLSHKVIFSVMAWIIYAVLLWGRHTLGWRGAAAIRFTLGGFAALMLAYFCNKLVLEVILQRV